MSAPAGSDQSARSSLESPALGRMGRSEVERFAFLSEASELLSSSLKSTEMLDRLGRILVPRMADWFAVDAISANGKTERISIQHVDPDKIRWAAELEEKYPTNPDDVTGVPNVLRTGKSEFYPQIPDELLVAGAKDPEHLAIIRSLGFTAAMIVPLRAAGQTVGALTLVSAESKLMYSEVDLALAEFVGRLAGTALANARLYQAVGEERERLRGERQRLSDLIAAIPGVVWEAWGKPDETTQRINFVSDYVAQMLGYSSEEWLSTPNFWLSIVHPEDRETAAKTASAKYQSGQAGTNEFRWVTKDGRTLFVRSDSVTVRNESGAPIGMRGITLDVTERRLAERARDKLAATLEERVAQRTAELQEANKELEAFSYSVSHDLRAPIRHIAGFAEKLRNEIQAEPGSSAERYTRIVIESAKQMGVLIDALLSFSRMGRVELRETAIDMNALAREVIDEQRLTSPGRQVEVEMCALPASHGDPLMLRSVLSNLVSNAFKYTAKTENARVELGGALGETEVTYFVRDNGAGFDMRHAPKLFGVFQRLHRADEFEGTGIGLANVRRIVSRHGGRTWAEGALGQGATFYFTLPRPLPVDRAP